VHPVRLPVGSRRGRAGLQKEAQFEDASMAAHPMASPPPTRTFQFCPEESI